MHSNNTAVSKENKKDGSLADSLASLGRFFTEPMEPRHPNLSTRYDYPYSEEARTQTDDIPQGIKYKPKKKKVVKKTKEKGKEIDHAWHTNIIPDHCHCMAGFLILGLSVFIICASIVGIFCPGFMDKKLYFTEARCRVMSVDDNTSVSCICGTCEGRKKWTCYSKYKCLLVRVSYSMVDPPHSNGTTILHSTSHDTQCAYDPTSPCYEEEYLNNYDVMEYKKEIEQLGAAEFECYFDKFYNTAHHAKDVKMFNQDVLAKCYTYPLVICVMCIVWFLIAVYEACCGNAGSHSAFTFFTGPRTGTMLSESQNKAKYSVRQERVTNQRSNQPLFVPKAPSPKVKQLKEKTVQYMSNVRRLSQIRESDISQISSRPLRQHRSLTETEPVPSTSASFQVVQGSETSPDYINVPKSKVGLGLSD